MSRLESAPDINQYEHCRPELIRRIRSILPPKLKDDAEDCAQNAYFKFWQTPLQHEGNPEGLLFKIGMNEAHDLVRRDSAEKRGGGKVVNALPTLQDRVSKAEDPASALILDEERQQLREAMAGLSPNIREAMQRVHIDGMTYSAAAKEMHLPDGTIKSRLWKGTEKLRKVFHQTA